MTESLFGMLVGLFVIGNCSHQHILTLFFTCPLLWSFLTESRNILSENISSVIFLVFSIGLVLVRKLRERHHTDGPGGGGDGGNGGGLVVEGELQTVGGSVLQSHDVIFPSEADGGENDKQLLNPREPEGGYDRRLGESENFSNISFRQQPAVSREKYASDQWDERTHIKLNPLYHNYNS